MGFGGGPLIARGQEKEVLSGFGTTAAGLAHEVLVMGLGTTPAGLSQTFLVMGIGYAKPKSVGWLLVRVPADDWQPPNPPQAAPGATGSGPAVSAATAIKLPQFWLLWVVLAST